MGTLAPTAGSAENATSAAPTTESTPGNGTVTLSPTVADNVQTPEPTPSPEENVTAAPSTAGIATAAPTSANVTENATSAAPSFAPSVANETSTLTPTPLANETSTAAPSGVEVNATAVPTGSGGNVSTFAPTVFGDGGNVTNSSSPPTGVSVRPTAEPTSMPTFGNAFPTGQADMFPFADGEGISGFLHLTVLMEHVAVSGRLEGLPPNCVQCFVGIHAGYSCNAETGFDSPGELVSKPFVMGNGSEAMEISDMVELAPITR